MTERDDSGVTLGELGRRLDAGFKHLEERLSDIAEDYLRRDLYDAFRKNDQHSIALLEDRVISAENDVKAAARERKIDRRLMWSTLFAPLLVGIALLVFTTLGKVG